MKTNITYSPVRLLSISSGAGWWSHSPKEVGPEFDPIAVFALVEVRVDDKLKDVIIPLSAWELDDLNENIAQGRSIPRVGLGAELYHDTDFEVPGQQLREEAQSRSR